MGTKRQNTAKPHVISYIRFSHPKQLKGKSLERQIELGEQWAAQKDLTIDKTTFRDLGVSAFHGANSKAGALGAFLQQVDDGRIPLGSILLVESLDRISREDVTDALQLFIAIVKKGIKVVTLSDGHEYDESNINNAGQLMYSLTIFSRANEESAIKSIRVKDVWNRRRTEARKSGKLIFGRVPAWLKVENGKLKVIPERAAIVREIFRLSIDGYGTFAIAQKINAKHQNFSGRVIRDKTTGKPRKITHFSNATLHDMLTNRAVLGEFQPRELKRVHGKNTFINSGDPIKDYYPAIISEKEFYLCQKRLHERRKGGGAVINTERINIFKGICHDMDGYPLYQVWSGPKRKRAYVSAKKSLGLGPVPTIPADEFDGAILFRLGGLFIAAEKKRSNTDIIEATEARITEIGEKIKAIKRKVVNDDIQIDALVEAMSELDEERKSLTAKVHVLRAEDANRITAVPTSNSPTRCSSAAASRFDVPVNLFDLRKPMRAKLLIRRVVEEYGDYPRKRTDRKGDPR